jgi:REP element-mobilizing transposase RayT
MYYLQQTMTVRRKIQEHNGLYFITFTCARWLPLFEITSGYKVVYQWFDYLKSRGHSIIAYTIMPNHVHCLIAFKQSSQSINTIVANGKRFMAYDLVKLLQEHKHINVLAKMSEWVNNTDRKRNKKHEVFEPSFDCKECRSTAFVWQKIHYIHQNAAKEKGNRVVIAEDYQHSSASQYFNNIVKGYEVLHYGNLDEVDLSVE